MYKYKDDGVRWGELPHIINFVKATFHKPHCILIVLFLLWQWSFED